MRLVVGTLFLSVTSGYWGTSGIVSYKSNKK